MAHNNIFLVYCPRGQHDDLLQSLVIALVYVCVCVCGGGGGGKYSAINTVLSCLWLVFLVLIFHHSFKLLFYI